MGEGYFKDAYQQIYKHPKWEPAAREFEEKFAANLYNDPVAAEAGRQALTRFAALGQAYYKVKGMQDPDKMKDALAMADLAGQISGDTVKADEVMEKMFLPEGNETSGAGQVGNAARQDKVTGGTAILKPRDKKKKTPGEDGLEDVDDILDDLGIVTGDTDFSDSLYYLFREEDDRIRDEMATAAGLDITATGSEINQKNLNDIGNNDGSLREMMTLLYNGTFRNGGRNAEQIGKSTSFKNLISQITPEEAAAIEEYGKATGNEALSQVHLNFDVLDEQSQRKKGGDMLDSIALFKDFSMSTGKHRKPGHESRSFGSRLKSTLSNLKHFIKHDRMSREMRTPEERAAHAQGEEHYKKLGLGLSKREAAYGKSDSGDLKWQEGEAWFKNKKPITGRGMLQMVGPSGTTMRMMAAYKMIGASKNDLLNFRLALIAWMGTSHDHSIYEILKGSEYAGIKGTEDLSEAATMYQTIDPLTTSEIRDYAPAVYTGIQDKDVDDQDYQATMTGGQFPHEAVYRYMLNELTKLRSGRALQAESVTELEQLSDKNGLTPDQYDDESAKLVRDVQRYSAQNRAINVYTSQAYQTMTLSSILSKKIGDLVIRFKKDSYNGRDEDLEDKNLDKSKLYPKLNQMIQLSARLAQDAVWERIEGKMQVDSSGKFNAAGYGSGGVNDVVYRGSRYSSDLKNRKPFTTNQLTSMSKDSSVALRFARAAKLAFNGSAVTAYRLKGFGADVEMLSMFRDEKEVLIPKGITFRPVGGVTELDDPNAKKGKVYYSTYEVDEAASSKVLGKRLEKRNKRIEGQQGLFEKNKLRMDKLSATEKATAKDVVKGTPIEDEVTAQIDGADEKGKAMDEAKKATSSATTGATTSGPVVGLDQELDQVESKSSEPQNQSTESDTQSDVDDQGISVNEVKAAYEDRYKEKFRQMAEYFDVDPIGDYLTDFQTAIFEAGYTDIADPDQFAMAVTALFTAMNDSNFNELMASDLEHPTAMHKFQASKMIDEFFDILRSGDLDVPALLNMAGIMG